MTAEIDITEYQARRKALLDKIENNAIVIIPSAQEVTRSNDTEYHFRQNSDFFYLTGFTEPDAFLVLSNKTSGSEKAGIIESTLFLRPKDEFAEVWHGRRLGVANAPSQLMVSTAYSIDDIESILPDIIDGHEYLYYSLNENLEADARVQKALSVCKNAPKQSKIAPTSIVDVNAIIHEMRLIKSSQETAVMRQSADISCKAHTAAMQICAPGVYEYQLEATILHCFAMHGARHAAYNTIVGGGDNACILHYVENQDKLVNGDLVLIDAGSEYQGYAADITRTFPVNGHFSPAQKDIYNLVLKAQVACISELVPGATIPNVMETAVTIITQGLLDLGILQGELASCIANDAHKPFFMHGLGHYLGLDVHDVGTYKTAGQDRALEVGMVITVEPGIYISKNADVPAQYKGIGVRIEDNIVITPQGNEVLTNKVPKSIDDIEALMASQ
jgi:Xaa-Pro aminopeptidase